MRAAWKPLCDCVCVCVTVCVISVCVCVSVCLLCQWLLLRCVKGKCG